MDKKEEMITSFDNLEHDIKVLQQMVSYRDKVLDLYDNGTPDEKDKFMEEWDALERSLVTVELLG